MPSNADKVEEILIDFLKPSPKVHLLGVARIYNSLTDEEVSFETWDDAVEEFQELDWSTSRVREMAELSKQLVHSGETRRSETYFNIADPDNIDINYIENEFRREQYEPEASGSNQDGFKWNVEDGVIDGQYIYTDIDKELSFSGDVKNLSSEDFIEFRLIPEKNLLILESTSVVDVQKTKGYFGRKTNMEISVCGPLTVYPDDAVDMVNDFLDTFEEGRPDPDSDEPGLLQIDEVRLHYPHDDTGDENLENINFEGDDIGGHDDVADRLSNGWIIKGFSGPVFYKETQFTMTIAGTGTMAYAKITGSTDHRKASNLMDIIRDRYMDTIRVYTP